MSGIVLSASVRQNLLSLQSTASLLATTQNDLATGNKVNTALDNPTEFFTAQSLNNRASDISNLLDGIGNGVQVLQAANTGITSLQSLVASAQSIANQVLQSPTGYDTKSNISSAAISGATANNLLGTAYSNNTLTGTAVTNDATDRRGRDHRRDPTDRYRELHIQRSQSPAYHQRLGPDRRRQDHQLLDRANQLDHRRLGQRHARHRRGQHAEGERRPGGDRQHHRRFRSTASTVSGGKLVLSTGTAQNLVLGGSGNALAALGLSAGTTAVVPPPLSGQTLTIAATGGGTPTSITFGTGAGQISTLNQLNAALAANNLQAGISTTGVINIVTTNDAASATIGAISGTAVTTSGQAFNGVAAAADPGCRSELAVNPRQPGGAVQQRADADQHHRAGRVLQRRQPVERRHPQAGVQRNRQVDAQHPGRHLQRCRPRSLAADLGSRLPGQQFGQQGPQFARRTASTTLRGEASALGSNLSIVEIRQDFSKNLINVLQTGASNLTLADTNEEAANSQALSTRQSIAVSALALANQSQASVLQLLR